MIQHIAHVALCIHTPQFLPVTLRTVRVPQLKQRTVFLIEKVFQSQCIVL